MQILKNISKCLASMKITLKFGLAFSLLLVILLVETLISFSALSVILKANDVILANAEMQRLAMSMGRNWKEVQFLRFNFFIEADSIGFEQAHETYALPAGGMITEVIRDGAMLKRQVLSSKSSTELHDREPDLDIYLSTVSQYATLFEEATALKHQLSAEMTGLYKRLDEQADILSMQFSSVDQSSELYASYYEMRFLEHAFLNNEDGITAADLLDAEGRLRKGIEGGSMQPDQKESVQAALEEYENLVQEIYSTTALIHEKGTQMDDLNQSIEPVLVELMISVNNEVGFARLQIEETRQHAVRMLAASMGMGLISAILIAVLLHFHVTRNIVELTRLANQFHGGNLTVRARIDGADELGKLASTFNEMAEAVESLNTELRDQAIRDSLTGLFNRRYHDETLPRELNRAARENRPISMVMIDMDKFKQINDEFGHAIGDKILGAFGEVLRNYTRKGDVACRFGGDEFVVLLPGASLTSSMGCVQSWTDKFNAMAISIGDVHLHPSFSAGIVEWIPGEDPKSFFTRADAALYKAKDSGRGRIYADDLTGEDPPA